MFRRGKKKEPKISAEEVAKMKEAAGMTPAQVKQSAAVVQPAPKPVQTKTKTPNGTAYFIGKKEITQEKQTIETKSGQIIELPESTTREIIKDIYQLTKQDLVEIIKGASENSAIHKLALKMLTNEL
jgi:hypothetical protein